MSWGTALGAWISGVLYDSTGTYHLALLLNLVIAWVASGLALGLCEWWGQVPQSVPSPVL